jgi:nucleoside-diphosphate-sugar epimerase
VKVVVTGGSGHIGMAFSSEASRAGLQIVAPSRSVVDITSDACVDALARELGPEVTLVHLAAWHPEATAATGASERRQLLEANVRGTMRVLEAARQAGVSAVVYASTFEVYGGVSELPVSERSRVLPLTDYGACKLSAEDHLISFSYEQRSRIVALRLPAVYGPGEKTPRALPNFLKAVAAGKLPEIHGDGADLRDQLHVKDAAQALLAAVRGKASGIFNVNDGDQHSVRQIAELAIELAGLQGPPLEQPRSKPRRDYHMSIELARSELGFSPRVSLRDGMAEQLAWLRGPRS